MQIQCPQCRHEVAGDDITLAAGTAVCRACGEFFPLPAAASARPTVESVRRYRPDDLPMTETHEGEVSVLRLRASRQSVVFTLFFSVAWWTFLVFWYARAIPNVSQPGGWLMVVFPLVHVAAGVGILYGLLGQLFSVTTLRLGGGGLSMTSRPFPQHFAVRAPLEVIDGFGVYDATTRGSSGMPTPAWQVQLMRADGTATALRLSLRSPAHAQYVADLLNARLGALREAREPGYRTRG